MKKKNRIKFLDMGRINSEMLKVTEYTHIKKIIIIMYGEIRTNRTVLAVSILMFSSITSKSIAIS